MRLKTHYIIWGTLAALYALLTILLPQDANSLVRYHLTSGQARLISLTFVIPYIAIWFAAFYGFVQCKAYAALIESKKDGRAFKVIGHGLMLLAYGLPLNALTNNIFNQIRLHNPGFTTASAIIGNYIALLIVFFAFLVIRKGTAMLAKTIPKSQPSHGQAALLGGYIGFAIVYLYVTMTNPARQFPTASAQHAAYYLPDILLLLTIVLPYIIVWYWGLRAAYDIHLYRQRIKGVVYKDSLGLVAKGLVMVVGAFAFIRFLASLTTLVNSAALRFVLAILYMFLFIISAGYILIAVGAKRLKKIEEV